MDLRYPIGQVEEKTVLTAGERRAAIEQMARIPAELRAAVAGLSGEQLAEPYRPDGWTVRQVAHHLADAHLNGYTRFKLALTEDLPLIKPYDQARWAELPDSAAPVEISVNLVEALHRRWVILLEAMRPEDFAPTLYHPERGLLTLDGMLDHYAWHGRHHVAQITALRERNGWR